MLMFKIKQLGIDGSIYNRTEEWLSNRRQMLAIYGTASDWEPVTSSVPEGSVLRTVMSIIYINDFDVGLSNFISKLVNSTKIVSSIITTSTG